MRNPVQQAVPRGSGLSPELRQQSARAGHEQLGSLVPGAEQLPGLRSLIRESWQRSAQLHANPTTPKPRWQWTARSSRNTADSTRWPRSCP